jgi:hypothetical protein
MSPLHHDDFIEPGKFPENIRVSFSANLNPGIQSLQKFNKTAETVGDARE